MAVLVTGGAGYIGTHTCVELLNSGYDIIVVDNFDNSKPESLKRVREITGKDFKQVQADLLDRDRLEAIFQDNRIEAVIHFAGLKAVGESVRLPLKYYHNNITGTLLLAEVMQKHGVKKIVFSSSATVYGMPERVPIDEEMPLGATNPYGRTKLMIEDILRDIYISDPEWSIALLRYFNPIGAHASGRIGEDPNGIPNNLMPYVTQVAVGKLKELQVFGSDYPTPDGTGVRDYIHVVDLALGHVKAVESVLSSTGVEAYNLGTGNGYSVLEMVRAMEQAAGRTIPYRIVDRRPGDVAVCYANPVKAREKLGWSAERGLAQMCEDAWRWQQQNPDGYGK
ncbi:UDP-glucose 4-epimerase GalE [Paenibacillus validus]|uniref:UDP-glucose 4-epimerase n=1 Tax=Paenibacillus validus TaxID=44253 RepID=A0A7X3CUI8_9BACL|nr:MULTISPECIES: UDP-glucose 4-epimerase GalE [Paenibacillus]MED4599502.1 UDP-glucose 4-epimerase GalE [Paenibacillus validus]MED4606702.1 UDP-glucose 4-epimerase GalE [Paenibacillus validus]MUG73930.1 UDP-glucose 4-epimerase GalE [Paenibacillus validus]